MQRWCLVVSIIALGAPGARAAGQPRERRLHLASAEASSYLVNDWNRFAENYLPLYVGDDDPRTAWDLKTEGIGEWIRMHVTPMEGATHVRMKIRNGYQKSRKLFAANSRAKTLTVVLLPSNKTVDVELTDSFGWQELAVDQPAGPLAAIELRVKAVYPGKKYDDLCLSDVQLYVTATTSDNPVYEKQRFQKILTWKEERAAAARLFKTELGKSLPIAAQYQIVDHPTVSPDDPSTDALWKRCQGARNCWMEASFTRAAKLDAQGRHAGALRAATALVQAKYAGMTPVRIAAQDKRQIPRVDGLCTPNLNDCEEDPCEQALALPLTNQLGYLRSDGIALVEQTGLPSFADVEARKPAQCHHEKPTTFAWAMREPAADGGAGRVRAVLLSECGLVDGREGPYPTSRYQLLVYADDGQLELVADPGRTTILDWDGVGAGRKLAGAWVTDGPPESDLRIESSAAVAAK